ncbi:PREDICTED: protein SUPPRESSOR OF NIM1 1-like [Camelina sativa]|uniref:Protein SUPPRESSOR OF NIM1 1-like n=1 Tax=Camelina sativa TaxID=90675 RepID=A0ABM0WBM3_CAMSA|nr:PREDICTED: protein SUPPRESSOR OF NIM1 1-like [Camelina sativa]
MGQCLCLEDRVIEQPPVNLPWELEEEILTRLPPHSLVRFKTVCKRWNSLFNDKSFLNNHFSRSRPQFFFQTNSKIYSADIIDHNIIDPTIELRELPASFDIPYEDTMNLTTFTTCDELLFCTYQFWKNGTALWNPWLRQVKWIEYEPYYKDTIFCISGLGYDNSRPQKVYKVLGYFFWRLGQEAYPYQVRVAIYQCTSHTFTIIDTPDEAKRPNVSLNGNLYWITSNVEGPSGEYFIRSFDFSTESFKPFCLLPCQKNHLFDMFILAVYERDRFSLLKQYYETRKIDIWVTKKSIDIEEEEVVWLKLMTLPTNNLRSLCWMFDPISYFIYGKTLFMCCGGHRSGVACIYVVREDLCKEIRIGTRIFQCWHCVYTPNFISLP